MARKLHLEKETDFDLPFAAVDKSADELLEKLADKKQKALALSPELNAWFGELFPVRR